MISQRKHRLPWMCFMAFGLLTNAGCLSFGAWNSTEPATPTESNAPGHVELPPAKRAQLHLTLAESLEKNGHDADAASCYEKARADDPHLPNISRRLASVYDRLGESKRALEEYQKALKAAPRDPQLLNRFGYFYYTRGQWQEAEEKFRQALAVSPNLPNAWINLGLTLGQQNRYDESLSAFGKVVSQAEASSNLAFVLTTQGKTEEAKKKYREAIALDPNLRIAQLALEKLEQPNKSATSIPPAPAPTSHVLPDQSPIVVDGTRSGAGS